MICRCVTTVFLPGAGDRCGPGEGFQPAGIGETGPVIADLGQHPGASQAPQAGEAGDDRGVRVLLKMGDGRLRELVDGRAGGVELAQHRRQLDAHRGLDLGRLMQVGAGENVPQPVDVTVEIAAATGLDQQPAQPRRGQHSGLGGGGRGEQVRMVRASRRASPPLGSSAKAVMAAG